MFTPNQMNDPVALVVIGFLVVVVSFVVWMAYSDMKHAKAKSRLVRKQHKPSHASGRL